MQSYAQIKDPDLTLTELPALGRRLALPAGWSYRTRVLKRSLTLGADGRATILQDELQNTYQLARVARKPGPRRTRTVRIQVHDHNTLDGQSGTISVAGRARW